MKELFTLYYHRRILFTDFFSQSRKTPIYQKSHVNYSELLQLVKGWSNLVSNRIIIWRLLNTDQGSCMRRNRRVESKC